MKLKLLKYPHGIVHEPKDSRPFIPNFLSDIANNFHSTQAS